MPFMFNFYPDCRIWPSILLERICCVWNLVIQFVPVRVVMFIRQLFNCTGSSLQLIPTKCKHTQFTEKIRHFRICQSSIPFDIISDELIILHHKRCHRNIFHEWNDSGVCQVFTLKQPISVARKSPTCLTTDWTTPWVWLLLRSIRISCRFSGTIRRSNVFDQITAYNTVFGSHGSAQHCTAGQYRKIRFGNKFMLI